MDPRYHGYPGDDNHGGGRYLRPSGYVRRASSPQPSRPLPYRDNDAPMHVAGERGHERLGIPLDDARNPRARRRSFGGYDNRIEETSRMRMRSRSPVPSVYDEDRIPHNYIQRQDDPIPSLPPPVPPTASIVSGVPPQAPPEPPAIIEPTSVQAPHTSKYQPFQYLPLQENEIRLLKIMGERTAMIHCEIFHASLDKLPSYKAISYTWGDLENQQKIQIGADKFSITTGLHGALKALRRKTDVIVWADGLCINQDDKEERSEQVSIMSTIYRKAHSVAIWLGPNADDSAQAIELLIDLARYKNHPSALKTLVSTPNRQAACAAVVYLFERDYWDRLWVVQEVFNARMKEVYCGDKFIRWDVLDDVVEIFTRYETQLKPYFVTDWADDDRSLISKHRLRYSNALTHGGPSSFPDVKSLRQQGKATLLEVLKACRNKLSSDPHDKVYAILGLLPMDISDQFKPNYNQSIPDLYIHVFDTLVTTTKSLDVICEAVQYPVHRSSIKLPSWVPDWSQIPQRGSATRSQSFNADRGTAAKHRYLDESGKQIENAGSIIEITGIEIDIIRRCGIAVDVLNGLDHYLMAFLHWRALHLEALGGRYDDDLRAAFCRTLCLDQTPDLRRYGYRSSDWGEVCFHVFASLLRERLPWLKLDEDLLRYANTQLGLKLEDWKKILNEACHNSMQGRSFCLTEGGLMGLGTGSMQVDDIVVVALGCHSPIILRPDGNQSQGRGKKYRYAGDIYVHGYMNGEALDEYDRRQKELSTFVIY